MKKYLVASDEVMGGRRCLVCEQAEDLFIPVQRSWRGGCRSIERGNERSRNKATDTSSPEQLRSPAERRVYFVR